MSSYITALTTTIDKKYLFVGDWSGIQKQIDVKDQNVTHEYGKVHDGITSMATTFDTKYLFTIGWGADNLKQFRIIDHQLIKTYNVLSFITSIIITFNDKDLFVGNDDGYLKQICVEKREVIKEYGRIHTSWINSMAVTRDNNYLITSSEDKNIKKVSIINKEVVKDFGEICSNCINTIQMTSDNENLFVFDGGYNLKLIELTDGNIIKDFSKIHDYSSWNYKPKATVLTTGGQFLFTISEQGYLKQFCVKDRTLIQDFGKIAKNIVSICY